MYTLAIETSTEQGVMAILKADKVVFQGLLPPGYENSKHLLPEIDRGFKNCSCSLRDFEKIVVGIGPGSYTGIRVGVMTAKMLAFAGQLPLMGLCSLETWNPETEGKFAVLIDAKIGGAYVIIGEKLQGKIHYLYPPQICPLDRLKDFFSDIKVVLTPKRFPLEQKLERLYPGMCEMWRECSPCPLRMVELACEKYRRGEFSHDGHLDILYLRKTQAEIEQDLKKRPE